MVLELNCQFMSQFLYDTISDATVQIFVGENRRTDSGVGSGFHLLSEEVVVTNAHVVESVIEGNQDAYARTEDGDEVGLQLLEHSFIPQIGDDYAIFELDGEFESNREALEPTENTPERGNEVIFSGFPHGISDLLIHQATISGYHDNGVYLDGAVNGGNSGGPVILEDSAEVMGIVTYKRFVSHKELQKLEANWRQLQNHEFSGGVSVGGVNLMKLFPVMADSFDTLSNVVKSNANTGIGMSQNIGDIADLVKIHI